MADHKFSKKAVEAFLSIGDCDFHNPISLQPWMARSAKIAKQRIYEKYLKNEDIIRASWLQKQANKTPFTYEREWVGFTYLRELLDLRSGNSWRTEMNELVELLPDVMGYAQEAYGEFPKPLVQLHVARSANTFSVDNKEKAK